MLSSLVLLYMTLFPKWLTKSAHHILVCLLIIHVIFRSISPIPVGRVQSIQSDWTTNGISLLDQLCLEQCVLSDANSDIHQLRVVLHLNNKSSAPCTGWHKWC